MKKLSVVVPCFNEEEVLPETVKQLSDLLKNMISEQLIMEDSFILFVDDGSSDNTWEMIEQYHKENTHVQGLKLAGNVGHQNALFAGLMTACRSSDIIVSIDADLQDDINVIRRMVLENQNGFDIVYGVRDKRETDTFLKRNTALAFYKFMDLMGAKTIYNHADFRLMSKRAVEHLETFEERNLFLRGMIPLIGYKSTTVCYDRSERFAGKSKYSPKKMITLALDGITSFSVQPMTLIFELGVILLIISIFAALYSLGSFFFGVVVPGWTSLMLSIWFIGSLILISLGVIGQYIGKIYTEVKRRPRYNIEKYLDDID